MDSTALPPSTACIGPRSAGHLAHPNRINVTLTRARSKPIIFNDPDARSRDSLMGDVSRQEETTRSGRLEEDQNALSSERGGISPTALPSSSQ